MALWMYDESEVQLWIYLEKNDKLNVGDHPQKQFYQYYVMVFQEYEYWSDEWF